MKTRVLTMVIGLLVLGSLITHGQMIKRQDAIWARTTASPLTLDGVLDEAAWAVAESVTVMWAQSSGMPGGGWYAENGQNDPPADPTNATLKFLIHGDSLYVGVVCRDQSVGGGPFNRFDGLLMNLRQKVPTGFPGVIPGREYDRNGSAEYFYGWVKEGWADTTLDQPGTFPGFFGWFGGPQYQPRPDSLKEIWDAVTTVQGTQNDDSGPADVSWTTELKFGLAPRGYDVSLPGGEIVMWSGSIYDADYQWPLDTITQSGNRTWLQCPWGNGAVYGHMNIHVRSDVTTASGAVPEIGPDLTIPNGANYATPVVDGKLDEEVWMHAPSLRIKFGDASIRNGYPTVGPFRSGQFQPTVNGGQAAVTDPSLATVKYFFKGDELFLGFDVSDRVVQSVEGSDRWDGFRVTVNMRDSLNGDHVLFPLQFTFRVNEDSTAFRLENLAGWDSAGTKVPVALSLKGGTTIDTLGASPDSGYTAEMKIMLTELGYPAGRGDGVIFLGITYYDGDSFTPATNSYGTRTWYMREAGGGDGPAWAYMDPTLLITDVADAGTGVPERFALLGNYPNPFNPSTTIKFQIDRMSDISLEVFDMLGRRVAEQSLGMHQPGLHTVPFNAGGLASGTYYYRLRMNVTGATLSGKMVLLK